MSKEQLIDRHAQTLKSWVGTGLAKDECIGLIKNAVDEALFLYGVSNWVAISSTEQPEIMTDVMVKYKDDRKEVAFFDGDKRFYIEKDDRDITETIVEWHKLP